MLEDADLLALQEVRTKVEKAWAAWQKYRAFTQEQIDRVVEQMAAAARENSRRLAELAVQETGYGNAEDKLAKNLLSAELLPKSLRGIRTVGVLRECPERKIVEIGVPMGVIAAILPTTNPTSTAIYKILISLKAGNAVVLSPHPRARRCTCETAEVMYQAALSAGAPEGIIECVNTPTLEATNELMKHRRTAAILSTGGSGIVKAAYSSGKPAFGVGPGNVPVLIDRSADIREAVAGVVSGKSFDYGTLCSSEQTLVAERGIRDTILKALKDEKAYLCSAAEKASLEKVLLVPPKFAVNPECVGQPAPRIAQMAGFKVPDDTRVLVCEIEGVGSKYPLSAEKLSPVLSLLFTNDFDSAVEVAKSVLEFHGLGHTCGIYSRDDARTREYALRMPAMRVLCNTPTPQGSVGITTNLQPAMTLGCGAVAGNITGDNIGPKHLINIKRLAWSVRAASEAFDAPIESPKVAAMVASPGPPTQASAVNEAIERYLAKRGLASSPAPAVSVTSSSGANTEALVDRFLSRKSSSAPAPAVCPLPASPAREESSPPADESKPSAVTVVDFVGEQEIREAVRKGQKIYIGPKTIVTPLARDLAAQHDTLVVAER